MIKILLVGGVTNTFPSHSFFSEKKNMKSIWGIRKWILMGCIRECIATVYNKWMMFMVKEAMREISRRMEKNGVYFKRIYISNDVWENSTACTDHHILDQWCCLYVCHVLITDNRNSKQNVATHPNKNQMQPYRYIHVCTKCIHNTDQTTHGLVRLGLSYSIKYAYTYMFYFCARHSSSIVHLYRQHIYAMILTCEQYQLGINWLLHTCCCCCFWSFDT